MNRVRLSISNLRLDGGERAGEWMQGFQEEVRAGLLRTAGDAEVAGGLATRLDLDRRLKRKVADAVGQLVASLRGRIESRETDDPLAVQTIDPYSCGNSLTPAGRSDSWGAW